MRETQRQRKHWGISSAAVLGLVCLITVLLAGCQVDYSKFDDMSDLKSIPEGFAFETTQTVTFELDLGAQYPHLIIDIAGMFTGNEEDGFDETIGSIILDDEGVGSLTTAVPSLYPYIALRAGYIGLPSAIVLPVTGSTISFALDEPERRAVKRSSLAALPTEPAQERLLIGGYEVLSTYDSYGVPSVMTSVAIDAQLLQNINASLPENLPVPEENPDYLSADTNIILDEDAEVFVTFIHEGAGYKNTLGYYTYVAEDGPPDAIAVSDLTIMFPNASLKYSGGMLSPGDTVSLGTIEAGMSIGWVLIANAWSASALTIKEDGYYAIYYSDAELNPEAAEEKRGHTVLLQDVGNDIFIVGFEDLNRTFGGDEDFNDAVFMVTVTPPEAVRTEGSNFESLTTEKDTDEDTIVDTEDAFPDDPNLASEERFRGTLAFEDLWPKLGDYDFNDLVIEYSYAIRSDAAAQVREFAYEFTVRAIGAGYHNAFHVKVPFPYASIATISQNDVSFESISEGAVSVDDGEAFVILISDDVFDVLGVYTPIINTEHGDGANTADPQSVTGEIVFTDPLSRALFASIPYDPFILQDGDPIHEIHLPNHPPSGLDEAVYDLFGTEQDDSIPGDDRYYLSQRNLPWVLHLPGSWDYPLERSQVIQAYHHFAEWALTGGAQRKDWYRDLEGYRDPAEIY